jgi:hypothetical protein
MFEAGIISFDGLTANNVSPASTDRIRTPQIERSKGGAPKIVASSVFSAARGVTDCAGTDLAAQPVPAPRIRARKRR